MARKIMGVKGFFHPKIGGGGSFCLLSISNRLAFTPDYFRTLRHSQGQKGTESGQKGSKVNEFLVYFGVSSGISETRRGEI